MMRPFYSDYIRHAMRFYSRNTTLKRFNSEVDRENWQACRKALSGFPERDKQILIDVYGSRDTLEDSVFDAARVYGIEQGVIWDLMKDFEHKAAKRRKLI